MSLRASIMLRSVWLLSTVGVAGCALPAFEKVDHSPLPNAPVAIVAGGLHSGALFRQGDVKLWGGNETGQLGLGDTESRGDRPGEMGSKLPYLNLGKDLIAQGLAAGGRHSCALLPEEVGEPGIIGCWGSNEFGQLGTGNADDIRTLSVGVDLRGGKKATAITAGGNHSCALLEDAAIKCWGLNDSGQLGLGDRANRGRNGDMGPSLAPVDLSGRRVSQVSAGGFHTCALIGGQIACWGSNQFGQLGIGNTEDRGTVPGHMGDGLYGANFGGTARSVAAGGNHTCALLENADIKCWGANGDGQLGLGDTENRCDQEEELGAALKPVDLGQPAKQVAAGDSFTCALLTDGRVKCWGANDQGQLGVGDTANRGTDPSQMGAALPQVQLGAEAQSIAVGGNHACAILVTEEVKCWGANGSGQLGIGNTDARGDNPGEMGDKLAAVGI